MPTSSAKKPETPLETANYHHGNLRAALLEAAGKLLEQGGPAALSLRAVARQLGVSHNAPYRHFATREDLLAALATEGFHALSQAMAKTRRAAGLEDDIVNWMGLAYIDFALKHPARYRLMFGGAKAESAELSDSAKESFATPSCDQAQPHPISSRSGNGRRCMASPICCSTGRSGQS